MSDNTIFDKSDDPQTGEVAEPQDQEGEAGEKGEQEGIPTPDFIGEGKKYRSVEDALKSIPPKEDFIEQLKRENEELRGKLEEASTVDDILGKIGQSKEEEQQAQQAEQTRKEEQYQLNQEDIAKIIDSRISEREQHQTAQQNISSVVDKMTELYGERAEEVYNKRAEELNVPVEWLNETAARSPNAVYELFGIGKKDKANPSKLTSSYNSESINQPQKKEHKTIMWGASTDDVMSNWRSAKPQQ